MIRRVLLAVFLCGIASGLVMGVLQMWRLTPLLLQAETYERADGGHDHDSHDHAAGADDAAAVQTPEHKHDEAAWAPADGPERISYTFATTMVAGAAWAALLTGVAFLTNIPLTRRNGAIWGLCGFIAATLAPSLGLPPELPGMAVGDLVQRQIWWVVTVVLAAAALVLLAKPHRMWSVPLAILLLAAPQLVGAPQPLDPASDVPAGLAASFVANSVGLSAVFWVLTGTFLGLFLEPFSPKANLP